MPRHKTQVISDIPQLNQVNFDHPHKDQVSLDAHTRAGSFSDRTQKQVIFDHPHKNQVNRSPYHKQVIFVPHTKT